MEGLVVVLAIAIVMALVCWLAHVLWSGRDKEYCPSNMPTSYVTVSNSKSWISENMWVFPAVILVPIVLIALYFLFHVLLALLWNLIRIIGGLLLLFLLALAMCS